MISGVSPHPLVVNMGLDFKQDLKTKLSIMEKDNLIFGSYDICWLEVVC